MVGTLSIGLITVLPHLFDRLPLGPVGTAIAFVVQWLVLFALILGSLSMVYRFGPAREDARWRWITLGSFIAGGLWIAASGLFSWYATSFAASTRPTARSPASWCSSSGSRSPSS